MKVLNITIIHTFRTPKDITKSFKQQLHASNLVQARSEAFKWRFQAMPKSYTYVDNTIIVNN